MAWNFFESIATMPGQQFLLLYASIIALALALCRWSVRQPDWTAELPPLPIPSEPDPYEVAYLRGGANELSRLLIFSLMERGYLSEVDPKKHQIQRVREHSDLARLTPIELAVLESFSEAREIREVFREISERIEFHYAGYRERLESQELLVRPDARTDDVWAARIVGASVILGLGAYKLLAASAAGHANVGLLIPMAGVSLVVLTQVTRSPRLSSRGQDYVKRIRIAYGPSSSAVATVSAAVPADMLLVGLFGLEALQGPAHDMYSDLFPKASSIWSMSVGTEGCGAGCGAGCGGCGCGGCGGCA